MFYTEHIQYSTIITISSLFFFFFFSFGTQQQLKEKVSINIAILRLLQEIFLLHHLHVNGNFVGENSRFSWDSLFHFKETSCECWREISSMQKVRVHVRAIHHSWVSDISMLHYSPCMWCTACWTAWIGMVRLEKGLVGHFFYLLLTSLLQTDLTSPNFAAFLGRQVNLWVGGNRKGRTGENETAVVQSGRILCQAAFF